MLDKQELKAFHRWAEGAARWELEDKLRQLQVLKATLREEAVRQETNHLIRGIGVELAARDELERST